MAQGFIYDQYGNHASKHQDGGVDEISVAGLSGLLADDQHVLDAEVLAAVQVKVRVYLGDVQADLTDDVWTKVLLGTENYDVGNNFDAVTNKYFTAPTTGYYLITASVGFINLVVDKRYGARINKNNGTELSKCFIHSSVAASIVTKISDILFLSTGDTIQLDAYSGAGVNTVDLVNDTAWTNMAIHLLST